MLSLNAFERGLINLKDKLESLVSEMHTGGITYSEGVREFKKRFILHVLRANHGNQCKAAREMGMHRNTLPRTANEVGLQRINGHYIDNCSSDTRKQAQSSTVIWDGKRQA